MPATHAVVHAHIDEHVKEEATAIFNAAGLTVSDAFRMMLIRTIADKALPFDPLVPNTDTIEAMKEVRGGNLPRVNTVEELLEELNAESNGIRH